MENKFARAVPELPVANVTESAAFYRDVLGFKIDWTWGENDYGAVSRDDTVLYLCAASGAIVPHTCIINVTSVDPLCAEWRAKGAKIVFDVEDKPWGLREFTVEDNSGHRFRVSQPSVKSRHVAREPVAVNLVERLPTMEEYRRLTVAVNWESFTNYESAAKSLPQSLFCVVVEHEGEFAGMARVIGDGAMFYYVMDVAVIPDLQGRGIGTALMNAVVDFILRAGPERVLVGLFTGANRAGFYQRFGFEGPETWLSGMSSKQLRRAGAD
jgi:GNAT superfamily N-acetyltransferase